MKQLPAPNIHGKTEFERFDNAIYHILTVSKSDVLKMEDKEKSTKKHKKTAKKI